MKSEGKLFRKELSVYSASGVALTDSFLYLLYHIVPNHAPRSEVFKNWNFPLSWIIYIALPTAVVFALTWLTLSSSKKNIAKGIINGLSLILAFLLSLVILPVSLTLITAHLALLSTVIVLTFVRETELDGKISEDPNKAIEQLKLAHNEILFYSRILMNSVVVIAIGGIGAFITILWSAQWYKTPYIFHIGQTGFIFIILIFVGLGILKIGILYLHGKLIDIRNSLGK